MNERRAYGFWDVLDGFEENISFSRLSSKQPVRAAVGNHQLLEVTPQMLEHLASNAAERAQLYLPPAHQRLLTEMLASKATGENERFIASALLLNSEVSARTGLPLCQDGGTVLAHCFKGRGVFCTGDERAAIADGIAQASERVFARDSQLYRGAIQPDNSPYMIEVDSVPGGSFHMLLLFKGAGSANQSRFLSLSPDSASPAALADIALSILENIGVAACPPYHVGICAGGPSPSFAMKTASFAAAGYLRHVAEDGFPANRDPELERLVVAGAKNIRCGAQFGGSHLVFDACAVRLPRHSASLFFALCVACSAPRRVAARIDANGFWIEDLASTPSLFIPPSAGKTYSSFALRKVDFSAPESEQESILASLRKGDKVLLSGPVITARDVAHSRFLALLAEGRALPDYLMRYPVYYAGPSKAPEGRPCGSLGPTTSRRMDSAAVTLMGRGAGLVTIGKGGRSPEFLQAAREHGGVYFALPGGASALITERHIKSCEVLDYPDLGMEAVRLVELDSLPALVAVDSEGGTIY